MIKCVAIIFINVAFPLSKRDHDVVKRAQVVCKEYYKACTKKIEKLEENRWYVTCGGK